MKDCVSSEVPRWARKAGLQAVSGELFSADQVR